MVSAPHPDHVITRRSAMAWSIAALVATFIANLLPTTWTTNFAVALFVAGALVATAFAWISGIVLGVRYRSMLLVVIAILLGPLGTLMVVWMAPPQGPPASRSGG